MKVVFLRWRLREGRLRASKAPAGGARALRGRHFSDLRVSRAHMRSRWASGMVVTGMDACAVSSSMTWLMRRTANAPTRRPKYRDLPSGVGYFDTLVDWPSRPAIVASESSQLEAIRRATVAEWASSSEATMPASGRNFGCFAY